MWYNSNDESLSEGGTTVGTILSAALSAAGGTVDPKYTPAIGSASHSPSYDFTTKKPKSGPTASSATTQQVATTDNPGEHPAINPTPFPTKYPTKVPTLPPKGQLAAEGSLIHVPQDGDDRYSEWNSYSVRKKYTARMHTHVVLGRNQNVKEMNLNVTEWEKQAYKNFSRWSFWCIQCCK